jgi:hypothetical protein
MGPGSAESRGKSAVHFFSGRAHWLVTTWWSDTFPTQHHNSARDVMWCVGCGVLDVMWCVGCGVVWCGCWHSVSGIRGLIPMRVREERLQWAGSNVIGVASGGFLYVHNDVSSIPLVIAMPSYLIADSL